MSELLNNCNSIKSLPDISTWNTSKVINMQYMFSGCYSIINLLDISKWNTSNVTDMAVLNVFRYHIYQIYQNGILQMYLK